MSNVYCTACGTPATSGEPICNRCGAALPQLDLPPPPPARPWEAEAGREAVLRALLLVIVAFWIVRNTPWYPLAGAQSPSGSTSISDSFTTETSSIPSANSGVTTSTRMPGALAPRLRWSENRMPPTRRHSMG